MTDIIDVISYGPHKCCDITAETSTDEHHQIKRKRNSLWLIHKDLTVNCVPSLTESIYFVFSLSVDSLLSTAAVLILPPALLLFAPSSLPPLPSCPVGCDDALTGLASVLGGDGIFVAQQRGLVQE